MHSAKRLSVARADSHLVAHHLLPLGQPMSMRSVTSTEQDNLQSIPAFSSCSALPTYLDFLDHLEFVHCCHFLNLPLGQGVREVCDQLDATDRP